MSKIRKTASSPSAGIRLGVLLGKICVDNQRRQAELDQTVMRRAASLAANNADHPLNKKQRALLREVGQDDLRPEELERQNETAHIALLAHSWIAREEIEGERPSKQCGGYFDPSLWDYVAQAVYSSLVCTDFLAAVDGGLKHYAVRYHKGTIPQRHDVVVQEIALLDRKGFTRQLLSDIWQKYPDDARRLELPEQTEQKHAAAWKRLRIRRETSGNDIAQLDGREYRVRESGAAFLNVLKEAKGRMVKGRTLSESCSDRADRIYGKLPPELQSIIDLPGKGRQGYRML